MRDHVDRVLAQWRAELPELDPTPMSVIGRVSRAARLLERQLAANFARYDLQQYEFDLLATLRRTGPPYQLTAGALSEAAMVTSGAITNRIDRLVARELVTRETDLANRRIVLVTLTDRGRQLIEQVVRAHVDYETELLTALTPQEQDRLAQLLRKLLLSLDDTAR